MPTSCLKPLFALVLAAASALVLAQDQADPPARVGGISLVQGQVTLSPMPGSPPAPALPNWPVTGGNQLITAAGARAEIRIGATAVQIDGDTALDVTELDDQHVSLRLFYGSVSVHVRDAQMAGQFELSTPQAWVRLREPGRVRVDAERVADTTVVSVLEGSADADAGGNTLTLRAGKSISIHNEDVQTGLAAHDGFDDWAAQRDRAVEVVNAARYLSPDMTGYDQLDQYGDWRDNPDYGPLWTPRGLPSDWVPYRDGSWAWVEPWGWTWIDNAPWGYAPFHYGRWVMVGSRWCWAPGRGLGHPAWAPALVGWVGGSGWDVRFAVNGGYRSSPGMGWYPLGPRDAFVPSYHASATYLERVNIHLRNEHDLPRFHNDERHAGITVVPHEQFAHPGMVPVTRLPHAALPAGAIVAAPRAATPMPQLPARVPRADLRAPERRDDGQRRDGRLPEPQPRVPGAAPFAPRTIPATPNAPAPGVQRGVAPAEPNAGHPNERARDNREPRQQPRDQHESRGAQDQQRGAFEQRGLQDGQRAQLDQHAPQDARGQQDQRGQQTPRAPLVLSAPPAAAGNASVLAPSAPAMAQPQPQAQRVVPASQAAMSLQQATQARVVTAPPAVSPQAAPAIQAAPQRIVPTPQVAAQPASPARDPAAERRDALETRARPERVDRADHSAALAEPRPAMPQVRAAPMPTPAPAASAPHAAEPPHHEEAAKTPPPPRQPGNNQEKEK